MNPKNPELWDQLRTAYRPPAPALDTASIMDAIRREAAVHPLRRASIGLAAPVPGWVCTAAALLAIFAAGFMVGRSVTVADQHISAAWTQTVQPDEFAASFMSLEPANDDSSL